MNSILSLLLISLVTAFAHDARYLNYNLQNVANIAVEGPSNHHQCFNHCKNHKSKSTEWKNKCMGQCDNKYGPQPGWNGICDESPEPDCYIGGWPTCCDDGNDGLSCPKRTKPPCNAHVQPPGGLCGKSCSSDSDCQKGGYNGCLHCGQQRGTQYHHRCYSPTEDEEELQLIALDTDPEKEAEDITKGTSDAVNKMANRTADGAKDTADGAKKAWDATEKWGKDTFDPNSAAALTLFAAFCGTVALHILLA